MSKSIYNDFAERVPTPGPDEDGNHVVDIDFAVACMVWHEYRDHFPVTENEYAKLIRPYFKVGDTTAGVINKLWHDGLVEPSLKWNKQDE